MTDLLPSDVLFIPGATPQQAREIQAAALLPEGTLVFRMNGRDLYKQSGSFTVIQIPTGETFHWVTRDEQRRVRYVHASPGTGTREAVQELKEPAGDEQVMIAVTWSASQARLYVGSGGELHHADATPSARQVRVGIGGVYTIGDKGMTVSAYQEFRGGERVIRETALELWQQTVMAIEIHMRGTVVEGYLGEVVQANLALVMLATGVEGYCGRRFSEIPHEGRRLDLETLVTKTIPKTQRPTRLPTSLDEFLKLRRFDFGNYENARDLYRAAYGLSFADDLGVPVRTLQKVGEMLWYRDRIVHVSPMEGLLNAPDVPARPPVFSNRTLVEDLQREADTFIKALHEATLRLPASNGLARSVPRPKTPEP